MRMGAAILLLLAVAPVTAASAESPSERVYDLIDARLELMRPVAAWKDARGVAVEDRAREAVVLEKAVQAAGESGIEPESAAAFFLSQIEAAKEIQFCWLARWEMGTATPPEEVPDLKAEFRPQLIRIGADLLSATQESLATEAAFTRAGFQSAVQVDCLSEETRDGLFEPLSAMRLAP